MDPSPPKLDDDHFIDFDEEDDEESESDIKELECEIPSSYKLYINDLFDLEDDEINEDLSPFKFHDNQLFDSYNEENESGVREFNCNLACVPLSQENGLFDDVLCIDDDIPLMEPCWNNYEDGSYKLMEPTHTY